MSRSSRILWPLVAVLLAACTSERSPRELAADGTETTAATPPSSPSTDLPPENAMTPSDASDTPPPSTPNAEVATLGAGCFWCIEAVLQQVDGVTKIESGYMGGASPNPTYQEICTGTTGHAEVVQVTFDPDTLSYSGLLDYFWQLHDPTTLNRQGNDVGTQYRSAIFYHSESQQETARASLKAAGASGAFINPIVTEITAADPFYKAEDYHQNYYRENSNQPYCRFIITPKLEKLGMEK